MTILDKLERKFGSLAIHNIAVYIVIGQVGIWVMSLMTIGLDGTSSLLELMVFDSKRVLQGEIWRCFSFPLIPPMSHPIFLIFAWYIFYLMAGALESQWGAFRLNVYMLLGIVLAMVSALLLPGVPITNEIWGMTIFLAFAHLFPDFELRLFFILPVKMRWLGWFTWFMIALGFFGNPWKGKVFILASVANYFLFFGRDIFLNVQSKQRQATLKAAKEKQEAEPFHVCSLCAATDKSDPDRDFRYRKDGSCLCERCFDAEKAENAE